MRARTSAALLAAALTMGCTHAMVRPETSEAQAEFDRQHCRRMMAGATAWGNFGSAKSCMVAKGYYEPTHGRSPYKPDGSLMSFDEYRAEGVRLLEQEAERKRTTPKVYRSGGQPRVGGRR